MTTVLDLTPAEAATRIAAWLAEHDEAPFRLHQILPRLWQRPIRTWSDATDLSADLRGRLADAFPIPALELLRREDSADGTVKFLWRVGATASVESVWIPGRRRRTLCISSQEGCAYGCRFCATGTMGFLRHLTPAEIAGQVREMRFLEEEFPPPTNIVFMGMGEPLHNWTSVDPTLTILNDPAGLGIGARNITVSTIGLVPALKRLAARPEQFGVAWSLHAAVSNRRAALMPIEAKYPLAKVQQAMKAFSRRVTLEYVMIDGANDSDEDARALAAIAMDLRAHVNLLPLHPGGTESLRPSSPVRIAAFVSVLRSERVNVTVRTSRGLDISAACGQLRTAG